MGDLDQGLRTVVVLPHSIREGKKILNDGQYWHVVSILKRLVHFSNPQELWDLKIERLGAFFELKLKGSLLGRINLRVYFAEIKERNEILILKAYKKEEDRQVGRHVTINLEDRLSGYLVGNTERLVVYRDW